MNTFLPPYSQDFTHSFTSWDLDTNNIINKTRNALIGGMQRLKYSTSLQRSSWVALDLTQFDIIHVMERRGTLHVCVGGGIKGLWVQPRWENNRQQLFYFFLIVFWIESLQRLWSIQNIHMCHLITLFCSEPKRQNETWVKIGQVIQLD